MAGAGGEAGPRVLVVADDLSGAADCAITWTTWGLDAVVALDAAAGVAGRDAARVLAVDTDSRRMAPEDAAAATRAAVGRHAGPDCRVLYKKIDSTLRGNPDPEIAAAAGAGRFAVVAPAFPAAGRTTENGRVLVAGAPLEATELWRREGGGRDPDLAAMLGAAGLPAASAPLAVVRGGGLADWLRERAEAGMRGTVCDAASEADLEAVAAAGAALARPVLWSGSAGLARHLRAATDGAGLAPAAPGAVARRAGRPVLVVVGSLSGVSRAQLEVLAAEPDVARLDLAPEDLGLAGGSAAWEAAVASLDAALSDPATLAVAVTTRAASEADPGTGGAALAAALARLLAPRLARQAGGLVATGGETARALLAAAGVPALRLAGEVEPGVPLGAALGDGPARGLPVVTKAGAFGGEATLARCVEALMALPCAEEEAA